MKAKDLSLAILLHLGSQLVSKHSCTTELSFYLISFSSSTTFFRSSLPVRIDTRDDFAVQTNVLIGLDSVISVEAVIDATLPCFNRGAFSNPFWTIGICAGQSF